MLSTYIALALQLYQAGAEVLPFLTKALGFITSGTAPTPQDWADIQALEAANSEALLALDTYTGPMAPPAA